MSQCGTTSANCRGATLCRKLEAESLKALMATLKAHKLDGREVGEMGKGGRLEG